MPTYRTRNDTKRPSVKRSTAAPRKIRSSNGSSESKEDHAPGADAILPKAKDKVFSLAQKGAGETPLRANNASWPAAAAVATQDLGQPPASESADGGARTAGRILSPLLNATWFNNVAAVSSKHGFAVLAAMLSALVVLSFTGIVGYGLASAPDSVAELPKAVEQPETMEVQINGNAIHIAPASTVAAALEAAGVEATAGRLLSDDGTVVDEAGGHPAQILVNDNPAGPDMVLAPGDHITVSAGADMTESEAREQEEGEGEDGDEAEDNDKEHVRAATSVWSDETLGSIHQVVSDEGGIGANQEGSESLGSAHITRYSIRPSEKVVALTFDDGPWGETTVQLLDLLKEHDVHATFFVVGTTFDGDEEATALVKREHDEGHQICSHTYTHAKDAPGFRMAGLSSEAQIDEIVRSQEAIARATGTEASKVVRMPGGAYDENVAYNVLPYVTYEIGWDIDTLDWRRPGVAAIEEALYKADPGDVILMHDGGGDRSQTVEALRTVLPKMKQEGWQFVTIDELLAIEGANRDNAAETKPSVPIPEPEPAPEQEQVADSGAYGYDASGGTDYGYTDYGYVDASGTSQGVSDWGYIEYWDPSATSATGGISYYDATGAYGGATTYYDTTGAYGTYGTYY